MKKHRSEVRTLFAHQGTMWDELEEFSRGSDGFLAHVGWLRLRAAFGEAALLPELVNGKFAERIFRFALKAPTPNAILGLLEGYYEGREYTRPRDRRSPNRWLSHQLPQRGEDAPSLSDLVSRLERVVPELGPLTCAVDASHLRLVGEGTAAEIEIVHESTVATDELVEAANVLLARRDTDFRLLPVASSGDAVGYLSVTPDQARIMSKANLWDEDLPSLESFASWRRTHSRASMAAPLRRTRRILARTA